MHIWIRAVSIFSILVSTVGLLLYIYTETAGLEKSMDIVGRLNVLLLGTLTVLLGLLSVFLLYKNWLSSNIGVNISIIAISLILFSNCAVFYEPIYTHKSQNRNIMSDSSRMTEDGKYKYHLELINLYQKNGFEQLVIENTVTKEIHYIKINLIEGRLKGYSQGDWVLMDPTDHSSQSNLYLLKTTENLFMEKKLFLVDMVEGTTQELK